MSDGMPGATLLPATLPNIAVAHLHGPDLARLAPAAADHAPRILLLCGSLRERSYSRFLTLGAERLLQRLGAETRRFDPAGLPNRRRGAPRKPARPVPRRRRGDEPPRR